MITSVTNPPPMYMISLPFEIGRGPPSVVAAVPQHRKQKSRRGGTPEGIRPRRLTLQRAPRYGRVALYLVIRQLRWRVATNVPRLLHCYHCTPRRGKGNRTVDGVSRTSEGTSNRTAKAAAPWLTRLHRCHAAESAGERVSGLPVAERQEIPPVFGDSATFAPDRAQISPSHAAAAAPRLVRAAFPAAAAGIRRRPPDR